MNYKALIISGTTGAGKTTLAQEIVSKSKNDFEVVRAVTTRKKRDDDNGHYDYLSSEEFNAEDLLVSVTYNGNSYGIRTSEYESIIRRNKTPIFVVAPDSLLTNKKLNQISSLSLYLDADDSILLKRTKDRKGKESKERAKKLKKFSVGDREYAYCYTYHIHNNGDYQIHELAELVMTLWDMQDRGGMLSKRLITNLLKFNCLLSNANLSNIEGASYDLELGDEYYHKGKISYLSETNPFLLIDPYDYVIVTSKETANMPLEMAGRFDIRVKLFCQGVILSNGTQIDPGFKGKLFCLLFNTSNSPVVLKRSEQYATIEFIKLVEATEPYHGKYQDKNSIIHYLPANTLQGGMNELKKEIEQIKDDSKNLQNIFLGIISLILALMAILITLN